MRRIQERNWRTRRRQGQVAMIVAVGITILLGISALVTDYGIALIAQKRLQSAIDAAVLAGAAQLMDSEAAALAEAQRYLVLNGVDTSEVTLTVDMAAKRIRAVGQRQQETFFGRLLGVNQMDVSASGGAIVGVAGSISRGLRPYAISDRYYDFGDLITLKQDSAYKGNFGSVALGGSGASVLRENALNGYDGTLKIGDQIDTETGNMIGVVNQIKDRIELDSSTFDNYSQDSYRLWTIPVVDGLEVAGRKTVTIVGFAQIFVEEVRNAGGKMEIVGRFMRFVGNGEIVTGSTDYGVYAAKLDQ